MRSLFRQTVLVTTALVGLTGFAFAAPPAAPGDSTAMQPAGKAGMMHKRADAPHDMVAKVEQRLTSLHSKLQITPAQQPQWDAFAQTMRDNARNSDEAFQARVKTLPTITASENMQSYARMAALHAQDMQKMVPVFDALYATMSERQKGTADQVFRDESHGRDMSRHR